ncbi:MAG: flagellar biosynthetic protein FliO, partial [Clostridiales Family XIII bacterium]|nr:flagellar biosynthetic protein FliO [Clostridiales Family XIII bacterium]
MWDLMGSLFSVVLALLGIILVLLLTYHVSRWYAAKLGPTAGGGRHIKIIDRVMVGKTGALLLVELSGTQYLVSVSERGAEILKELDEPVEAP